MSLDAGQLIGRYLKSIAFTKFEITQILLLAVKIRMTAYSKEKRTL